MTEVDEPAITSPADVEDGFVMPTETEIYILPDGRVVVADLPAELAAMLNEMGVMEPCELLD